METNGSNGHRRRGKLTKSGERDAAAVRQSRLQKIETMMLRGYTNHREMAEHFGCSLNQIARDIVQIHKTWRQHGTRLGKERKTRRIRQLEYVIRLAMEAFNRSQENSEEVLLTMKEIPCEACQGIGVRGGEWCSTCDGEGVQEKPMRQVRTKGQAGDPSFLTVAKACIAELNRIEGNYAPKERETRSIVGTVSLDKNNEFLDAPPSALIEAKAAISKLKGSVNGRPTPDS